MLRKVSVSLPDDVFEALDRFAREEGVSRSSVVAEALRRYLGCFAAWEAEVERYPTVLWKLRLRSGRKLRSPRRAVGRVRDEWVVEKF